MKPTYRFTQKKEKKERKKKKEIKTSTEKRHTEIYFNIYRGSRITSIQGVQNNHSNFPKITPLF
jgi:hypothetical protein